MRGLRKTVVQVVNKLIVAIFITYNSYICKLTYSLLKYDMYKTHTIVISCGVSCPKLVKRPYQ